jgi:hypothetical protein
VFHGEFYVLFSVLQLVQFQSCRRHA